MKDLTFPEALTLAKELYAGLTTKDGKPTFEHAKRVYKRVVYMFDAELSIGALFHDVIEDTEETPDSLRARGVPARSVTIANIVSRADGETYAYFIARVIASENSGAIMTKLADVRDHLDPNNGIPLPDSLRKRYEKAEAKLAKAAGEWMSSVVLHRLD